MTKELTKSDQPLTLRQQLERMTPEFEKALPGHIPAKRFVRTVQTAVQMNPDIAATATKSAAGMQSLMAACTKAATDGLIIDGREAALVTFGNVIQYIPMVAGLMKKARNSGDIASICAHVVHEKDQFTYVLGDDERIEHAPNMSGDRGEPIAVYAIVRMKDGSVQREVMDKAAVMRIAGQSRNAKQYSPKEGKNYGEWWRKTVIRRISKYLPSSSDRDEFMQAVERIDEDFEYSDDGVEAPAQQNRQPKKRGGAAAALKNVTPTDDMPDHDAETGEIIDHEEGQQAGDDI